MVLSNAGKVFFLLLLQCRATSVDGTERLRIRAPDASERDGSPRVQSWQQQQ